MKTNEIEPGENGKDVHHLIKPEHLTQLPEDVRATLAKTKAQFDQEDRRLESAILTAARDARLSTRVPALCVALHEQHPALSMRFIFRAVALSAGLHERYVARLYYGRSQCFQSR